MGPAPLTVLSRAAQPIVPWRNGAGTTREVAVGRNPAGDGFRWRISVAQVSQDGPFSLFPGIDRTIWLLRGAGMVLDVDGAEHQLLARLAPYRFRGEAGVHATLVDGPTEDLNLMVDRSSTQAAAQIITIAAASELRLPARVATESVLVVLAGTLGVVHGAQSVELGEGDAVQWGEAAGEEVVLDARGESGDLLWARFRG